MSKCYLKQQDRKKRSSGFFFYNLWKGLRKYWWLCLIISCVTAGLHCAWSTVNYEPMYESKASFTISTQVNNDEEKKTDEFNSSQSTADQMEKLLPHVLESNVMKELVKEEMKTEIVDAKISIQTIPDSNLFTLKAVSSDPVTAKQTLEATMKHIPDVCEYMTGETKLNLIMSASMPKEAYNALDYVRQATIGALAGLFISVILLITYAFSHKTICKDEDVYRMLNMKCIGKIPKVKFPIQKKPMDKSISILNEKTGNEFKESIRRLSIKLERITDKYNEKVILVTSTLPYEGKTSVALNLALALAEKGRKVLLVDLNLRNPSLKDKLKLPENMINLSDVLEGKESPQEITVLLEEGIYFMGNKIGCKNVTSLLTSSILEKAIKKFKNQMDYVIIDSPACEVISDAATIARISDSILYVIEQEKATLSKIKDGIRSVASYGTPIMGGVLYKVKNIVSAQDYYEYTYDHEEKMKETTETKPEETTETKPEETTEEKQEECKMGFLELAKERYSCRMLSDRKVEQEKIDKIIEAAIAAPTAKNLQPYKIFAVSSEERKETLKGVLNNTFGADTFLVVGADTKNAWVRPYDNKNFADVDAAIIGTHIIMEVADLGLATTWVGCFDAPKVKELFPEMIDYELVAVFPIGYPRDDAKPAPRHEERRDRSEAVEIL